MNPHDLIDLAAIRQHCELLHRLAEPLKGKGKLSVSGFGDDPETGTALLPISMKFEIGQVAPMVKFIAALTEKPHRNVYVPLAVLRPNLDPNKKGAEADVIGSLGLVGDFDDADAKNWRARLPVEAHLALETSRGRFQPFLLFDKPYPPEEVKPIAVRLKSFCHCDHGTADISHVWRVPGTLNWPNKKKFDEGRAAEPQPVRVVKQLNGQCGLTLDDLAAALPLDPEPEPERKTKQKPENEPPETDVSIELVMQLLPAKLCKQITEPGSGDRSKALFSVIRQLGNRGLDAIAIEHIIRAYPNGIGAKYVGRPDLDKEIERVLAKPGQPHETWKDQLLRNEEEKIRSNLANAIAALRLAPDWQSVLGFNEFAQKIVILGKAPWLSGPPDQPLEWASVDDIRMADWLQHNSIFVPTRTAGEAVYVAAHNRQFHPVKDYLQSLKWDGRPRLDAWCVAYLGAEDTAYVRAVGSCFLISGVARIQQPGCKADCALILEGPQSTLKSTAAFTLAQPWFTDEISELGTKDAALQLAGVWIIEWSELDSMTRADVEKIKAFMSRTADRFRPPYEKHVVQLPRQCVFIGTSNKTEYLRDETGGRRFWPIECGKIDVAALRRDRDQLWAEALHRYNGGANWWLDTAELNAYAAEQQATRRVQDPWEAAIAEFLHERPSLEDTTISDLLEKALNVHIERQDQAAANRVARCLRVLGWSRYQIRIGEKREWRYRPRMV